MHIAYIFANLEKRASVYAYESVAYVNKVVGHATFKKSYRDHVIKKAGENTSSGSNHCICVHLNHKRFDVRNVRCMHITASIVADASKVFYATASGVRLIETPLNQSYSCSMESQIRLKSNDTSSIQDVYLRITEIDNFQAFLHGKTFSKQSKRRRATEVRVFWTIGSDLVSMYWRNGRKSCSATHTADIQNSGYDSYTSR